MHSDSDNIRGACFMMLSMAGFVLNDTLIKLSSAHFDLFQAIFLRGLVATALIGALAWHQGAFPCRIPRADRGLVAMRVVGEVGATVCFLTALFNMALANATAILQAVPLAVALGANLFLGEAVGWRRYLAIAIGFAGILLIVRPGAAGFTIYSLYALGAVGFLCLRDLVTRRLSAGVPSLLVTVNTTVAITVMGGAVSLFGVWRPVTPEGMALLASAGVFILVGYYFGVTAMRVGAVGYISPFRYTILVWAILLGVVVFGDVPDTLTLIGAGIVVATGLYTLYRERVTARARRAGLP